MRFRPIVLILALLICNSITVAAPRPSSSSAYTTYVPVVRAPRYTTHHVFIASHQGVALDDSYRVIGKVLNQLPQPIYGVTISGTFYGTRQQALGTVQEPLGMVQGTTALPQTNTNEANLFQLNFAAPEKVTSYTLDVAYKTETSVEYVWVGTHIREWIPTETGVDFKLRVPNEHPTRAITDIYLMIEVNDMLEITRVETVHLEGITIAPGESYDLTYTHTGAGNGLRVATQAVVVP